MVKYTTEDIIDFIQNENPLRNPEYYKKNYLDYYNAARRRKDLGSWEKAVEKAECNYRFSLEHKPALEEEIENIITRRMSLGRNVNATHMHTYYNWLYRLVPSNYNSYDKLIEKCGIKYKKILKRQNWTREDVILDIIRAEQKNIDISLVGIQFYDSRLNFQARSLFNDHLEFPFITYYDYALINCKINPESVRIHKHWKPCIVFYDMREHIKQGHNSIFLMEHNNDLMHAVYRMGGFKKIVNIVKSIEEHGLFDKLLIYKQIEAYKKMISGLRNVDMEGRVRIKRDRSYIMNLGKHTKTIHKEVLESKLSRLEEYLLNADELKVTKQVIKNAKLNTSFLSAATPTRTIGCICGPDIIRELEDKYSDNSWRFFGPRTTLSNKIFYYHIFKEEELKHNWALEHLK